MRHLLKKISASKSKVIVHLKMGNDTFSVISRGERYYSVFDGCDIMSCDFSEDVGSKLSKVAFDFLTEYASLQKIENITAYRSKQSDDFEGFFEQLQGLPGAKKIVIKGMPEAPSEIEKTLQPSFDLEKAIDLSALIPKLSDLANTVTSINNLLGVTRDDALTLSKGKLINTMWGAKAMQHMLNDIHSEICANQEWERIEFYKNMILKTIDRLKLKLSIKFSDVCVEEQKMICTVLIPNLIDNYETLKKAIVKAMMDLSMLIHIDAIFKKTTSYPASWFLSGNMLEDLKCDYQKILRFMIEAPRIEQEVIYPLDFLKLQFLSGNRT
jgi:hypothetical protein